MKRTLKRTIGLVCAAAISLSIVSCGEPKGPVSNDANSALKDMEYPLQVEDTLTVWSELNSTVSTTFSNKSETFFAQWLEEETGVKVEYIHPSAASVLEQLNLLVASDELPDIVEFIWSVYPGGPAVLLRQGALIDCAPLIEEYSPALKAFMEKNPEEAKLMKCDDGSVWGYPSISDKDNKKGAVLGMMIRQDWLDELGLEVPETIDEWESMLIAFRDKKGATAPLTFNCVQTAFFTLFGGAYGVGYEFYRDGDEVKYGPLEDGYKEMLTLMNKWYKEGLLDSRITTTTKNMVDQAMVSGESGATYGYLGSAFGAYLTTMKDDPTYSLVAAKSPVLKKGEKPEFGIREISGGYGSSISSNCKNPELAAKWLDYAFTEEGHMLYVFGKEGVSYNMVDGNPIFTEEITNNPEGKVFAVALAPYSCGAYGAPGYGDKRYTDQYYQRDIEREAMATWSDNDGLSKALPPLYPTAEEEAVISNVYADIQTYVSEMFWKFIIGAEDLDNYDAFVETIKEMGIEDVLKVKNDGLNRFNSR